MGSLRRAQEKVKDACDQDLRAVTDSFRPLHAAVGQQIEAYNGLQTRYMDSLAERKKLHNLVLELKGNIRVFARVRPLADKEKHEEPKDEPTINYSEEMKLSVYDDNTARRKWFEFDRVFQPRTLQIEVFEEAKPLAVSVLDGYN